VVEATFTKNTSALLAKNRRHKVVHVKQALHVHLVETIEFGLGHLTSRFIGVGGASVVDHNVQAAELRQGELEQLFDVGTAGDIAAAGKATNAVGHFLPFFKVQIDHHHAGTFLRKTLGDAGAKA
jgi:hypothetical protein